MANYPDYVIRQIQENSGSFGQVPFVFYQIGGAGLKTGVPYQATVGTKK